MECHLTCHPRVPQRAGLDVDSDAVLKLLEAMRLKQWPSKPEEKQQQETGGVTPSEASSGRRCTFEETPLQLLCWRSAVERAAGCWSQKLLSTAPPNKGGSAHQCSLIQKGFVQVFPGTSGAVSRGREAVC